MSESNGPKKRKVVRGMLTVEQNPNGTVNVLDGEGAYVFFMNDDLSYNQWQFIVQAVNEQYKQGRFIPED